MVSALVLFALLFWGWGLFSLASAFEVMGLARSAMHEIYAAEITGNAILLFGFGFIMLGIAKIIDTLNQNQNNNRGNDGNNIHTPRKTIAETVGDAHRRENVDDPEKFVVIIKRREKFNQR